MSDDLLLSNIAPQASALISNGRVSGDLDRLNAIAQKKPDKMSERELREVANDFESLLVRQLLKEMRKTVPKDGFLGSSSATEMYQEMGDDALAKDLGATGGFGVGELVYQQLKEIQDNLNSAESIAKKQGEFKSLRRKGDQPDVSEFKPLRQKQDPAANAIPLHPAHEPIPMPQKGFIDFQKPLIPLDKVEKR
ncbi:MAG: rod-binding protein [bacterium]